MEFLVVLSKEDELPRAQGVFAGYVARIDSNVARAGAEGEERRSEYSRQEEERYQCSRVHVSAAVQGCTALLQREVRFCSCWGRSVGIHGSVRKVIKPFLCCSFSNIPQINIIILCVYIYVFYIHAPDPNTLY